MKRSTVGLCCMLMTFAIGCERTPDGEEAESTPAQAVNALGVAGVAFDPEDYELACADASPLGLAPISIQARAQTVETNLLPDDKPEEANVAANNEMHDCQWLVENDAAGQPQYKVFASLWVSRRLKGNSFGQRTVVAGIVVRRGSFGALRLHEGKNCVVIQGTTQTKGEDWQAWIVNIPDTAQCTANLGTGTGTWYPMTVYRDTLKKTDVAGRFIDTPDGYYIGLQCGQALCVIGENISGTQPSSYNDRQTAMSDFQRLAKANPAGNALIPSGLWGLIEPLEVTDRDSLATYETGPIAVARIIFAASNDGDAKTEYARKLVGGTILPDSVTIFIRHESGQPPETGWYQRIDNGAEKEIRFDPAMHVGSGGVRWRWIPSDEGWWLQCARGCCSGN